MAHMQGKGRPGSFGNFGPVGSSAGRNCSFGDWKTQADGTKRQEWIDNDTGETGTDSDALDHVPSYLFLNKKKSK